MLNARVVIAALFPVFLVPSITRAQQTTGPRDAYVMELRVGDRWLHSAQHPLFAPFRDFRFFTSLSPQLRDSAGTMMLDASPETGSFVAWIQRIRFVVAADGKFVSANVIARPVNLSFAVNSLDTLRELSRANYESFPEGTFAMPESRVWDIVPVVRTSQLLRGGRWTDTLSLSVNRDSHEQTLSGIRTSVVLGDTIVNGTRLWIISDNTDATVSERFFEEELTLRAAVAVERRARGTIRGRYLFDPALRLFRWRADTTSLAGTATLRFPDGRSFSTSVRFDGRRDYTLHSVLAFNERRVELANNPVLDRDRANSAMSIPSALAARLGAGETKATDSVFAQWNSARDPLDRQRSLSSGLGYTSRSGGAALTARIAEVRRSAGDSALIYAGLLIRPQEWNVATLRDVMIPSMADPQGSLAHGQRRDGFYNSVIRYLTENPPAINRDTARWTLPLAAYDFLAQQGRNASDSRLRDVGLLSLFVRDPQRWADSVRARARAGSVIVADAALLVDGATAYAAGTVLPDSGASWREWYGWIIGPIPAGRPGTPARPRAMTFSAAHARAIKMFEARTGRAVIAELQKNHATVAGDSARMVYATILQGLGALSVSADDIAERFRSGNASDIAVARTAVVDLFRDATSASRGLAGSAASPVAASARAGVADSSTRVAISSRVLEAILVPGRALRSVEEKLNLPLAVAPNGRGGARFFLPPLSNGTGNVFALANMPAATVDQWRSRATFMRREEFNPQDPNEGRQMINFENVLRAGPFVSIRIGWSVFSNAPAGGRRGGGGSTTLYLLEIDSEWVVVHGITGVS